MTKNLLFPFLKYVNPIWYFNVTPNGILTSFYDIDKIPNSEKNIVEFDEKYVTLFASKCDAAYQMWHKGFIKSSEYTLNFMDHADIIGLEDNYRFVRRHFHPIWSWFILFLRIAGLNAPFREARAFIVQANVKRLHPYVAVFPHESAYDNFESNLLNAAPQVSIIIPTLNRYDYLKDVLSDLEQQTYPNFDVIVIDQSTPFQRDFYKKFNLKITVKHQQEKALWLARNTAIKMSNAHFLLLFDDDSRIEENWISHHIKCLDFFQADISAGVSISKVGDKVPENYRFFRWADQLDTGNVLIKREVFEKIGLFDRQFEGQRMGDGEFGLRAFIAGFKSISNSRAGRLHLKAGDGGLREMGSWDGFRPKSWMAPRPVPSVLYFFRQYFSQKTVLYSALIRILPSLVPYRFKKNRLLLLGGSLLSILLLPLIAVQFLMSWRLASAKLNKGPLIDPLIEPVTGSSQ